MKNVTSVFFTICLIGLFTSCDDDSSNPFLIDTEQLVSIEEVFTLNNAPIGVTYTYTLDNGLNTEIASDTGTSQVQTFEDGKMVLIEYFNDDISTGTQTYTYDSNDRIISVYRSFISNPQDSETTYEYVGNQILATITNLENDGTIVSEDTYIFTLNNNNQIIKYENGGSDYSWEATYANGNLSTFKSFDGTVVKATATFSYTSELASEPYQKERFRFGSEWRNNIMLNQTGEYAFKQLAELGNNYLADYTYTEASDPSMTITLTASYEFDDFGRLTKQTKDKMFFQSAHHRVLTYQYE